MSDVEATRTYFRIVAPFDGVVSAVSADEGTFANPGQSLVTVENTQHYQLIFAVEEEMLPRIAINGKLPVRIPSALPKVLQASVTEISPAAGSVTRTFQVKADLPPDPSVRSGLSGSIELESDSAKSLWIPAEYLQRNNGLETVWVRQPEGWENVLVKSGSLQNGKIEILSGLNEGDEVGLFEASS